MRTLIAALLIVATNCFASQHEICELLQVPKEAKISFTHGADFASYPDPLPKDYTGCQYLWVGDGNNLNSMKKMSTAYFLKGRAQWLTVKEPKGKNYHCVYRVGVLAEEESKNSKNCPATDKLEGVE